MLARAEHSVGEQEAGGCLRPRSSLGRRKVTGRRCALAASARPHGLPPAPGVKSSRPVQETAVISDVGGSDNVIASGGESLVVPVEARGTGTSSVASGARAPRWHSAALRLASSAAPALRSGAQFLPRLRPSEWGTVAVGAEPRECGNGSRYFDPVWSQGAPFWPTPRRAELRPSAHRRPRPRPGRPPRPRGPQPRDRSAVVPVPTPKPRR